MNLSPSPILHRPAMGSTVAIKTQAALQTAHSGSVRFEGSFAGPPQTVTVKLPRRVGEQLNELSKTLGLPVEEIATIAASLVTQATDSSGFGNKRHVALVPKEALSVFKPSESSISSGSESPESSGYKMYSSFDMTMKDWKAWKKANAQELFLSRGLVKKVKDFFSSKKPFTYKFQGTEAAGGAALWTFAAIAIPGMQMMLPFTLPTLLVESGRKKRDLYNGINMLTEAVKAKQANPALELVSIKLNTRDMENNKPVIFVTAETGLFRKMKPAQ